MLATLKEVLELSKEILELCRLQAWDEIEAIEIKRSALVGLAGEKQAPQDVPEQLAIAELINEIEQLDNTIVKLLEQNKVELLKLKKQSNSGKKMAKAYQSGG